MLPKDLKHSENRIVYIAALIKQTVKMSDMESIMKKNAATSTETILDFAKEVVVDAGKLILEKRESSLDFASKGDNNRDIVTSADYASQELIANRVLSEFPNHGFLVEEKSKLPGIREITWIIDPIDGTISYSRHQKTFCVSIGIAINSHVKIGVIYDPLHDELFSAIEGNGIHLNGQKAKPHVPVKDLSQAIIASDWDMADSLRDASVSAFGRLSRKVRLVNMLGSAALSLAWISIGRLDGYFKYILGPWDVAAGLVMLREVGGQVSHLSGKEWNWLSDDKTCVASSKYIHADLVKTIAPVQHR